MTSFSDIAKAMQEKSKELDDHLTHLKKLNEELRDRSEKILVALEKLVGCTKNNDKSCTVCYSRPRTHAVLCGPRVASGRYSPHFAEYKHFQNFLKI